MDIADKYILVVEDDNVYRTRLAQALCARGLQPVEANSVGSAQAICRERQFDFAVIDLRIPGGSGLDVLSVLKSRSPDCRAVMLTGYGTITTTVNAMKLGAVHYLTKPTGVDDIVSALQDQDRSQGVDDDALPLPTLSQVEWDHIQSVLRDCGGNVTRAAKQLGLHRRSLQRKLAKDPGPLT